METENRRDDQTPFERGQEDARIAIEYIAGAVSVLADFFGEFYQSGYYNDTMQEESPDVPTDKTMISDCRACWCDSCAHIEQCEVMNVEDGEPDGIRPNPCIGCLDGMRGMPKENSPACGAYEEFDGCNNG